MSCYFLLSIALLPACNQVERSTEESSHAKFNDLAVSSLGSGQSSISSNSAGIYAPATLGLGEPLADDVVNNGWNLKTLDNAIDTLLYEKPKVFRLWIQAQTALTVNSEGTIQLNQAMLPLYEHIVSRLKSANVKILGETAQYPTWMTGAANWNQIPCPRTGVPYQNFLNNYETSMRLLAQTFPVDAWEPANEPNGNALTSPVPNCGGSVPGKTQFTYEEKARITLDLMFRAHRAVKSVNPSITVLMPGIGACKDDGVTGDPTLTGIQEFLSLIYRDIWTGIGPSFNPRDYFDAVTWHPYIYQDATPSSWIETNQAVYQIMVQNGDGNIPVVFSEVGISDAFDAFGDPGGVSPQNKALWLSDAVWLSQQYLPWLKWLVWFRGLDDPSAFAWGGANEQYYGIFSTIYNPQTETWIFGAKPAAQAYCNFSFCQQNPMAGAFKALSPGYSNWAAFWYNGNGAFCQYTPTSYLQLTGRAWNSDISTMRVLDPSLLGYTYVGYCQ